MSAEYGHFQENGAQYNGIEEWECLRCFKRVPSSGPSPYNRDACACVDAGSFAQDHDRPQQGEVFDQQGYQYQPSRPTIHLPPQSYASSSASAPCPEGPEREVPNTAATNGQRPVVVEPGLNDPHDRLSSSAPPGVSVQMWRFLVDQDYNRPRCAAEPATPDAGLLTDDFHLRTQQRGTSNKRRKASHQSIFSSSSDEHSFPGCDTDPIAWIGSWDEKEGYIYSGDDYPMTMSGLVEYPAEE